MLLLQYAEDTPTILVLNRYVNRFTLLLCCRYGINLNNSALCSYLHFWSIAMTLRVLPRAQFSLPTHGCMRRLGSRLTSLPKPPIFAVDIVLQCCSCCGGALPFIDKVVATSISIQCREDEPLMQDDNLKHTISTETNG